MILGPLIGAGIVAAGSLIGGHQADKRARKEARKQREFQERMRDTAWQAAVSDMETAGINPALAYSEGPAASPGGAMASQRDYISPAVSSAMQWKRLNSELQLIDKQTQAAAAQAQKTQNESIFQERLNRLWGTWTTPGMDPTHKGPLWRKYEADARIAEAMANLRKLEIPGMQNIAAIADTELGKYAAALRYILQSIKR